MDKIHEEQSKIYLAVAPSGETLRQTVSVVQQECEKGLSFCSYCSLGN